MEASIGLAEVCRRSTGANAHYMDPVHGVRESAAGTIAGTIILGVVNTHMDANEDEAVLRDYGFALAVSSCFSCSSLSASSGALVGFVDLLRIPHPQRRCMQGCLALFLNVLPWIIVGTRTWMV